MAANIGSQAGILYGGHDLTPFMNDVPISFPTEVLDKTTFRPPGFARQFIAGLVGGAISFRGFGDWKVDALAGQMASIFDDPRAVHMWMVGPIGLDVGAPALFGQTIKTNWTSSLMADGLIAVSADSQITAGSPATNLGRCLISPHGSAIVSTNEAQSLVFTSAPLVQEFGLRAVDTVEVFMFTPATSNAAIKAGIEALAAYAGRTATVTGSLTGSTLKSGTRTIAFAGTLNIPALEVLNSESELLTLTAVTGPGTWRTAAVTPGDSEATVQAALRAVGGVNALVVVKGSSPAIVPADLTTGKTGTGGVNPANLTDNNTGNNYDLTNPVPFDIDLGAGVAAGNTFRFRPTAGGAGGHIITVYGSNTALGGEDTTLGTMDTTSMSMGAFNSIAYASTAYRYIRITYTGGVGTILSLAEIEVLATSPAATSTGSYTAYFPYSEGNVVLGAVTGTGYTRAAVTHGNNASALVVASTTTEGGATAAIYNVISAAFNGAAVESETGAATSNGGELQVNIIEAFGADKTVTLRMQHSADGSTNWDTLGTLDAMTAVGAQQLTIAAGTTVRRYTRGSIDTGAITGSFVVGCSFSRN